ncbi:MAG TPA: hypothetical protein VEM95_00145, partial [Thermoplasmata archaeon]|nr:hypothetical protein [Thermoplasmata archaeon]
ESDAAWYEVVSRALRAAGITNADLRLVPPELPHAAKVPRGSVDYEAPEMPGRTFEAYARSIDTSPDASFDLVCVDGYARPACIAHALPKIRGGGYLLLDNSDWTVYRDMIASLAKYPRTDFGGVGPFQATSWRTSVWRI